MGGGVDKPDDRSLLAEGQKTLDAQGALAQRQFDIYSKWAPRYAAAGSGSYLGSLASMYPQMSQYVNDSDSFYRQGLVSEMDGAGYGAGGALRGMNATQSAIMGEFESQAQKDLAGAGNLSARDRYDAMQTVRLNAARQGTGMNNSAQWKSLQAVENLQNEREDRAKTFASNVSSFNDSFYSSPAYGILTASSGVPGLASNAAMQSAYGIAPSAYDPFRNTYAADVYNTNYNADWNRFEDEKNEIPRLAGASLGLVGSIVGGIFGGPMGAKIGGYAGKKTGYGFGTLATNI